MNNGAAAQVAVADAGQGTPRDAPGAVPLLPDWEGACLHRVVPGLLRQLAEPERSVPPPWFPAPVTDATQIVLLVIDGLGAEQLRARSGLAPMLTSGSGGSITSVAPSTTACALTTLVTGRVPAEHGVLGYRVALDGEVMNVLQWSLNGADARMRVPAHVFQPFSSFPGAIGTVPVVTRHDYGPTGFTAAHLGRVDLHRWHTPAGLVTTVRRLAASGSPFIYAYYEGIDKVAHAEGIGDFYDDELRAADRLVADVLEVLPPGAVLVVTADHGQVNVGNSVVVLGPDIMEGLTLISGEGRFRWLHTRPGAIDDVVDAAVQQHGDVAWVRTREQVIAEGWLGGIPSPEIAARLGDVALIPFEPIAFLDPADTGELRLAARHGSLTPDEMLIPLLGWRAG
ncbi:MAG TPA: alkaline phosphatase family protein [Acidimicrobiales bacterium]|nr:alkaline phosphatase family protein [Acidimicrobiales bacterium]